jgi:hypothetical protein
MRGGASAAKMESDFPIARCSAGRGTDKARMRAKAPPVLSLRKYQILMHFRSLEENGLGSGRCGFDSVWRSPTASVYSLGVGLNFWLAALGDGYA